MKRGGKGLKEVWVREWRIIGINLKEERRRKMFWLVFGNR